MAVEEGARTVRTFMESMKEQPLGLAMVFTNLALLGYLYYAGVVATNERHLELQLLYKNRTEIGQLLASCVRVEDLDKLRR